MADCCARVLLAVVVALATPCVSSSQETQAAPNAPLAVLQTLTVDGLSVFTQADLSHRLSLEVGRPLPKDPDAITRDVQAIYAEEGYTAARATSQLDANGALTIIVREGRLSAIEFLGVDADRRAVFQREF